MVKDSTEIMRQPGGEIARREPTIMDLVAAAVDNPAVDVAKMQALFDLKVKMDAIEAEKAYNLAMQKCQAELPRIKKSGRIYYQGKEGKPDTNLPYARYEDIDTACRPHLQENGLSVSYDTEITDKGVVYVTIVSHCQGHVRKYRLPPLPADTSGGKNPIQAVFSTASYAERYGFRQAFNIVWEGDDKDGANLQPITKEQALGILTMLDVLSMTPQQLDKFWLWTGMDSRRPEDIQKRQYQRIHNWLAGRIGEQRKGNQ